MFQFKKKEQHVEKEIMGLVEAGHEEGFIHENEADMISNILDFNDKKARDIQSCRNKIFAVASTDVLSDILPKCLESGFSRYPVYIEDIDHITGVLHLKDLVAAYLEKPDDLVSHIMDDTMFIHPTYELYKLLKKMQRDKIHMAIVLDEYGQTDGIVTLEDIIEEIVGNILDEHDTEEKEVHHFGEDGYVVEGHMSLNDLEELIDGLEFPEGDIETLNGFMLYKLGHLPREGENIMIYYGGYAFHPLLVRNRMIQTVRITKVASSKEGESKK